MQSQLPLDCDWQSQLKTQDAFWFMQKNQVACDVIFEVGDFRKERVGAHAFVLMSRSTRFFHEYLMATASPFISIPEVSAITFREFLRYLYTDKLDYTNWKETLCLANRYEVKPLIEKVFDDKIKTEPVDHFCRFVNRYENKLEGYLEYRCLKHVFDNQKTIFECDSFYDLPKAFILKLLSSEYLDLDESLIYNALFLWAEKACHNQSIEGTGENKRKVLEEILYQIRFPLLSQEFFSEHISEKGLLEDADEIKILKYYLHPKKPVAADFRFKTEPRKAPGTPFKYIPSVYETWRPRFEGSEDEAAASRPFELRQEDTSTVQGAVGGDASAASGDGASCGDGLPTVRKVDEPMTSHYNFRDELESDLWHLKRFNEKDVHMGWGYKKETVDAIAIVPSEDVALIAYSFYALEADKKMTGKFKIYRDNVEGFNHEFSFTCSRKIYDIYTTTILKLCKDQEYHLILDIEGGLNGYYGKGGKSQVTVGGVKFDIKQSKYSTNHTEVAMGQIFGFLFQRFKPIPYKYGLNFDGYEKQEKRKKSLF